MSGANSNFEQPRPPNDLCGRVRILNTRWLVHGGLDRDADAYIRHLEALDPARLARSCEHAWRMLNLRNECAEDPKPWFYAGLFSLATNAEAERFLQRHCLTRAAVAPDAGPPREAMSAATMQKLSQLRNALARLADGTAPPLGSGMAGTARAAKTAPA